ncbi:hypothetical protein PtA15_8A4 [Puccinia triticina]|uniref:Uncharacterized protein n=1 Tax=Puccinia triticina TaxID=208348 RepID=A0ABY7CRZ1_9BASI|nr:uncharacterized protein PtA15_8A4 [Puccinia triticina]WAQ87103.1 hypothetical protein PtA15_8A4 [Puccinia triticina]WAR56961.1 hypothetical protein PtB15_8B5 [Puccinia triticina]
MFPVPLAPTSASVPPNQISVVPPNPISAVPLNPISVPKDLGSEVTSVPPPNPTKDSVFEIAASLTNKKESLPDLPEPLLFALIKETGPPSSEESCAKSQKYYIPAEQSEKAWIDHTPAFKPTKSAPTHNPAIEPTTSAPSSGTPTLIRDPKSYNYTPGGM